MSRDRGLSALPQDTRQESHFSMMVRATGCMALYSVSAKGHVDTCQAANVRGVAGTAPVFLPKEPGEWGLASQARAEEDCL
jgi:hypothetical protein